MTLNELRRLAKAADEHIFDDATSIRALSPELAEYVDAALPARVLALIAVALAAEPIARSDEHCGQDALGEALDDLMAVLG